MKEDFGSDYITMVDENGEEFVLEFIESIDYRDNVYSAFLPTDLDENDPDYGLVLLRSAVDENGEEVYDTIDDEEELNDVYEKFMSILFADEDEE